MSSKFLSLYCLLNLALYCSNSLAIGMSDAALASGNPTMSTPRQSTSPAFAIESLQRANSIQQSIEAIESQFPADQRGNLEIDSETGSVSFNYIGVGGGSIMTGVCVNGQCGSAAGRSISCYENQVPNLSTSSCQCAPGYRPGRMDGTGGCISACPSGTSLVDLSANRPLFMCRCNDNPDVTMGFDGNPTACDANINIGEDCGSTPPRSSGYNVNQAALDEYLACQARNEQAEIERQRLLNEAEAQTQATVAAGNDLAANIESARSIAISSCESQTQSFNNQCRTVSAQAPPNENINSRDAGSIGQCRSLQRSSASVVGQVETQVQGCMNQYESIRSSCSQTTGPLTGNGSASVGSGPTLAEASETASDSGQIPENGQLLGQVQSVFTDLTNLSTQVSTEMRDLERQAEECIAAFEQDPDNSQGSGLAGLAQTAAQAFGRLDGSGSGGGAYDGEMGGSSFNGKSAAQSPGFTGSGTRGVSGSSGIDESGPAGFNGGGGDFDGSVGNGLDPSGPRNQASNNGPGQGNPGMGAMGMPIGGGVGRGAGNSGASSQAGDANTRSKRNFASADKRNLVLGYKKVTKDGQAVTFKQGDLEKIGKAQMLAKLEEAKKKFGEDTPLLFKNGKFVRDYLEMKNRLAWQRNNLIQKNRMSGLFNSAKNQQAKSFHPCAEFGECYTEARYNIFKLHHFKALKHIGK